MTGSALTRPFMPLECATMNTLTICLAAAYYAYPTPDSRR